MVTWPILGAGVGVVGVKMQSTCAQSFENSRMKMRRRR
jgi:hypothetical protein